MPRELRKRKAPASEPASAPPAKKKAPVVKAIAKVKEAVIPNSIKTNGAKSGSKVAVGDTINLEGFGGEIETNEGVKTTLKALVEESKGGVVLFTYPKASTPGCTTQVCLFRDQYESLTATGFSIFGLSRDSPKANTNFKTKQNLPYPLLCDTSSSLIGALGLKKAPASTTRGVFVVNKSGKVLASEAGGPAATVEVVKRLVTSGDAAAPPPDTSPATESKSAAPVHGTNGASLEPEADSAVQVSETSAKLDGDDAKPVVA
ncbi:hypothetical protein QTJ16_005684 [Diplocarpon rosae]|uniref:thioredoxin-dependent peroxiredoxin n=1 Tax=Diplocarpon rosae TaxID=946125 RepID=A0AAD9SX64_9HELO|nr:hypothetical protein QTJ16_005684 [Diplocarpon rosae]PBP25094.1 merozoite capping protein-1 [Diplocarpon rosae]